MDHGLYADMSAFIDTRLPQVTALRQDFHKYAEAGWHEVRTCSIIADRLVKMGYDKILMGRECMDDDSRMGLPPQEELDAVYQRALEEGAVQPYAQRFKDGHTAIVAVLETGRPGPVIALRADIDALGVVECDDPDLHRPAKEGFASVHQGEMHACGHDAHATVNLTVAETLIRWKDRLRGTVKLIWQPAEEGVRGARSIAASGVLDDVEYLLAVHMGGRPEGSEGEIEFRSAVSMANAKLDVYLEGKACHAASPQNGNNAMLAMAAIVQGVYGIPRASVGDSRINVGQVIAGSGRNVVCDRVKMVMELRGLNQAALDYIEPYARRIIEHAAAMHGCTCRIVPMGATPSLLIDTPELTSELKCLADGLGFRTVGPEPASTSEDYSYMAKRVIAHGGKSCYFVCLTDVPSAFHSVRFDIQEKDILNAVKLECAACLHLMGQQEA